MPRTVQLALLCSTLALGGTSAYLLLQLYDARAVVRSEALALQKREHRLKDLEAEFLRQRGTLNTRQSTANCRADVPTDRPHDGLAVTAPPLDAFDKLFGQPAGQIAIRAQTRIALRRFYGDISIELGLSPAEANRLYDILAIESDDSGLQRDDALGAMLGADRFLKFRSYERSLGERTELKQLADQLAAADVPLRAEQEKQILSAMLEERELSPQPIHSGISASEEIAHDVEWRKGYEQRLQERIASLMSPEQQQAYREYLEWRSAIHGAAVSAAIPRGAKE